MNSEIKRLLRLSNIPGFKLLPKEEKTLEEWKRQQVPVEPKAPKKRTYTRKKKTTNQVKPEEKETGELEES